MQKITDMQHFTNAAGLKKWLDTFSDADLRKIQFVDADRLIVHVMESVLSDGSTVSDLHIQTK